VGSNPTPSATDPFAIIRHNPKNRAEMLALSAITHSSSFAIDRYNPVRDDG
jgi:hypothetical protein